VRKFGKRQLSRAAELCLQGKSGAEGDDYGDVFRLVGPVWGGEIENKLQDSSHI